MTAIGRLTRAAEGVIATVHDAAVRTGVDFHYLLAQAKIESGLDPAAQARTSSARGLFQFTRSTWLETVRKHGAEHGLGWAADALANGTAKAGTAVRATILALRDDAEAASLMAGEFARDNAQRLETRLGRAAGATDLYLAHFLGSGGAIHFLQALAASPEAAAAGILPAAAAANRSVFFTPDGHARSLADVFRAFAARLDGAGPAVDAPAMPRLQSARNAPAGAARAAYMLLAELGG